MKDEKYFAGLFDADGSFTIAPRKLSDGTYHIRACATLYQKNQKELLDGLGRHFDVRPGYIKRDQMYYITFHGKKAIRLIEHLKKHLVIKRKVAELVCELEGVVVDKQGLKELKSKVKDSRSDSGFERNFPARKWMAGYVDGDGCLKSSFSKKGGGLEFSLNLVSHESQRSAIDLIHKCFGGHVYTENNSKVIRYKLNLTPNNLSKLEYFGKHLKIKHDQYRFVHNVLLNRVHYIREGASPESNYSLHKELQRLKGTRND